MHRSSVFLAIISTVIVLLAARMATSQADFSANQMIVPASVNAGGTLNFTYSVTNIGFPPTPPMSFSVYLSTNSTISTGDTFVQTVSNAPVGNGQSASVTIPANVAQGTWFIGFIVAPASGETFTANNVLSVPPSITILPPAPDLQAVSISGPTAVVRSQVVTLTRNIANIGGPAQSGPLSYDVVLSTNNTYEPTDTLLAAASSNTLGSLTINVAIPSNQAAGTYFYILRVLPYTGETITTNNNVASITQVTVVTSAPSISLVTPSSGPSVGGTAVTIYGTNFVGVPIVTFNAATALSVSLVSTGELTCLTPPNPVGQPDLATITIQTVNGSSTIGGLFAFGGPGLGTCGSGNTGLGLGGPFDVLFVDGSSGGFARRVDVPIQTPFSISVSQPPTNIFPALFAIVGFIGIPTPADITPLPFNVGTLCFPSYHLNPGQPGLFVLTNNYGPDTFALVPSTPAPWSITVNGLPFPFQFTLQGVINQDPVTVRVTNGVLVNVQ